MEAQCKGGVINDVVASIVSAGERRGLLGVGFENMMRSWVMTAGTERGGVSMAGGREDQSARKGNGVKRVRQIGAETV